MYGGRASDKCIASDSEDLFQNLESSKSSIMAVGGFLISGIINNINFNMSLFG
jgi:hypothetical protein